MALSHDILCNKTVEASLENQFAKGTCPQSFLLAFWPSVPVILALKGEGSSWVKLSCLVTWAAQATRRGQLHIF